MITKKEKLFINIVLAVFIAGIIFCFTLFPLLSETVSAEELSNNSVLNFNQLVNNISSNNSSLSVSNYSVSISSDITSNGFVVYFDSVNLIAGHVYYVQGLPNCRLFTRDGSAVFDDIGNFIATYVRNYTSAGAFFYHSSYGSSVPSGTYSLMICDLTQIFGAGNEPTSVAEFKSYFNNDFYVYTTSTLISLDTLQSYNNGVADTLNSYKYVVTANDSYNNLIPYGKDTEMTRGIDSNGRYYNKFNNSVNADNLKYAYFGFAGGSLPSGSKLTLTGYCLQGQTSPEGVDVAVLVGSNFVNVGHLVATRESWKYNIITFTLPYASSGIYFIGLGNGYFELSEFVIEIETTDFDTLYGLAYKRGQDSRDSDVTIAFENGKRAGMTQANPYSFNALFGAVFDAPIQAITGLLDFDILGVNMKGLYLSLFTLALIIFVVKLCLGKV